jgi:diaminopimelate epimerase
MAKISFSKMHGLGNDFMVLDGVKQKIKLSPKQIRCWADRHTGIGFDQLLLLEKSKQRECDFLYRIFNADGKEVAQCGNGARCIAHFIHLKKLSRKKKLCLQTQTDKLETELLVPGKVRVAMGIPAFLPDTIDLGNPHTVLFVDDVETAPVATLGEQLQHDPRFPHQINVGFAQVADRRSLLLRVYERGVGETQACGSGACAAVIAGRQRSLLAETVSVQLRGGTLKVDWKGEGHPVFLTGPAEWVFDGIINLL